MPLNNGKHIIEIINAKRCTLVEKDISESRMGFLKKLLEFNQYQVMTHQEDNGKFKIGVTDLIFNPVIDVYKRRLKTPSGHIVTPSYWLETTKDQTESEVNYWIVK